MSAHDDRPTPKGPPPLSLWPDNESKRRAWAVQCASRLHQGDGTRLRAVLEDAEAIEAFVLYADLDLDEEGAFD